MIVKCFGVNLKYFRKAASLTQEKAAEAIGISYPFYVRLENGHSAPSLETVIKITELFDIPMDFLFKDGGWRRFKMYSTSELYAEMKSFDDANLDLYADTLFTLYRRIKPVPEDELLDINPTESEEEDNNG